MADPYIDEAHGVLRNKGGLTDPDELARYEAECFALRMMEAVEVEIEATVDSYRDLHWHLFQDVYDWADQFRSVPLAKQDFVDSWAITRFASPEEIEPRLSS